MSDIERAGRPLNAVSISETDNGGEYYQVGKNGVTKIGWSTTSGHMAALQTIQVFKGEDLHSEHLFVNVLGVYYAKD